MTGIYIIKNTINNLVYIGQAYNIERRWKVHYAIGKKDCSTKYVEYNNQIHTAMRKLGRENFYLEVLEECEKEKLNEREKYWIKYYNSYKNGYNGTEGGDFNSADKSGENNGRALLTEKDVYYIRECYNNHIPFREVYPLFQNKISKRGLQKVWSFENWKNIHPEYNNEENKHWHSHEAKANPSEIAANNKRHFSKEQVIEMRKLFENGMSVVEIWRKFYPEVAKSTVNNAIKRITYKDIQ